MTPDYPRTFWPLIERRARATPDAEMVVDDLGRSLTSIEYLTMCEETAAGLARSHGVRPGTVVSWQLPTSIEALVLMGALARLEAIQNPVIPILRHREVAQICAQVKTDLLVVPRIFRGFDHGAMASELSASQGFDVLPLPLEDRRKIPLARILPSSAPTTLPPPSNTDSVRWIYHSSGTTAEPKGVRHTDNSIMHGATGLLSVLRFGPSDVFPIAFPIAHIGGMTALTAQLVSGGKLALCDVFDSEISTMFMSSVNPTLLGSAVPFFQAYLSAQRQCASPLFPHLRACVNGGAPKPPALHDAVRDELGGIGIISSWGLTEFPIATFGSPDDDDELLAQTEGRAVPGVQVRAVDADGRDVPQGEEGELWLRGPQCFTGYVDSRLDDEAFADGGWLRTGDLGTIRPSGHVQITGRIKDIIIRNAENLSALEIENAISAHPDVAEVAVVGLPDPDTGERACAVIVAVRGSRVPTVSDLAAHCSGLGLARQKFPEHVEAVEALPRNLLGKVLKRELRERFTLSHEHEDASR